MFCQLNLDNLNNFNCDVYFNDNTNNFKQLGWKIEEEYKLIRHYVNHGFFENFIINKNNNFVFIFHLYLLYPHIHPQ